jgi:hypothetical protein
MGLREVLLSGLPPEHSLRYRESLTTGFRGILAIAVYLPVRSYPLR